MRRSSEERVADALSLSALLTLYGMVIRTEAIESELDDTPGPSARRMELLNSPDFGLFSTHAAPDSVVLERAIQDLAKKVLADVGIDDPWPSVKKDAQP